MVLEVVLTKVDTGTDEGLSYRWRRRVVLTGGYGGTRGFALIAMDVAIDQVSFSICLRSHYAVYSTHAAYSAPVFCGTYMWYGATTAMVLAQRMVLPRLKVLTRRMELPQQWY